jgi:quinol monooxygenase YgiN
MSVIVVGKFPGDVDLFRRSLTERADELTKVRDVAQAAGCLHHRFGIGDGYVLVVDEWESPQHFEKFFADPDLQAMVASMGADPSTPPDITFVEAVTTADQF